MPDVPRRSTLLFLCAAALCLSSLRCSRIKPISFPQEEGETWTMGKEEDVPKAEPDETIVFAVLGDQGDPNRMQAAVAKAVTKACDDKCKFVLLLGDNLYEAGIEDEEDAETIGCIVDSYPTDYKFLVLGNHDYEILNPSLVRARAELGWIRSEAGKKVGARGGHHFYRFEVGPVLFQGLDTNYLVRGRIDDRYRDIASGMRLRKRNEGWTIAFGHHPYVSNGPHGDAGSFIDGGLSLWNGRFFRYFMDAHVIGRADLYLAGHDHNMQFFPPTQKGDTAYAIVGSGSRCTGRGTGGDGSPWFEHYGHGFAIIEASKARLAMRFYGFDGRALWGVVRTHDSAWRNLKGFPRRKRNDATLCAGEIGVVTSAAKPIEGCWQTHD
jgi:tartrate-resistant acid phosphatase type 5